MQTVSAYPNGPLPAATCHVERAAKLGWAGTLAGRRMLHIGPGTAHEIQAVQRVFAPSKLAVMTLNADEVAPIRAAGFDCELGDMHDAPFDNSIFGLIFSSNVMEHAIAPHVALLECRRMLAADGLFYMIVPTFETPGGAYTPWHVYCFNESTWRELLRKAGLAVKKFVMQSETLEGGAVETYLHFLAQAVAPPEPHDEILRRISALK